MADNGPAVAPAPEQGDDFQDPRQEERSVNNFALSPALSDNDVLDFKSKHGIGIWKSGTAKLSEELFDCNSEGLRDFLELVQHRGQVMNWDSVLDIPVDNANVLGPTVNFIANYGTLSLVYLRGTVEAYMGRQVRVAQDSYMLYTCLHNSLSKVGRDKVTLYKTDYKYQGTPSGILFLKVIIKESAIDSNATTLAIRNQLASIDTYLAKVNFDISKTHQHVQLLMEQLRARGETTNDLLFHIFNAYKTVRDTEFSRWVTQKESDYEEGEVELSAERLMSLAENKYKTLVDKKQWRAPTPEEEKIVALQSQINSLKNKKEGEQQPRNNSSNESKNKKNKKDDKKQKPKVEDWMLAAPKSGEPSTKRVNNKDWHWCSKHAKWCLHTTEQCKGMGKTASESKSNTPSNTEGGPRLVQAQKATVRFTDDSSDEE